MPKPQENAANGVTPSEASLSIIPEGFCFINAVPSYCTMLHKEKKGRNRLQLASTTLVKLRGEESS